MLLATLLARLGRRPHAGWEAVLAAERRGERADFARALQAFAVDLASPDGVEAAQVAFYAWAVKALADVLRGRSADEGACRRDALADLVADAGRLADYLDQVARRAGSCTSLHLAALVGRHVRWRASDRLESEHGRHAARRSAREPEGGGRGLDATATLVAREVMRHLGQDPRVGPVLEAVLAGHSVTEVAAALGISRQEVYRRLERVRAWVESEEEPKGDRGNDLSAN